MSKIEQVRQQIFKEIAIGNFVKGASLPAEPKLAEMFGVSYMTMRHAITHLVNEGFLNRVPNVGTYVAQDIPVEKLPRQLGLLLPAWSSSDFSDIMMYAAEQAEIAGWRFKVAYARSWEERVIGDLWDACDALLCCPIRDLADTPPSLLEKFSSLKKPTILLRAPGEDLNIESVFVFNAQKIEILCQMIYDLGHRNIATIKQLVPSQGKKTIMGRIGLEIDDAFAEKYPSIMVDSSTFMLDVPFFDFANNVLRQKIVSHQNNFRWSLLIIPQSCYWGAVSGLHDIGLRIPEDVSIVCLGDDHTTANYVPEPTRLSSELKKMTRSAMELVLRRIENPDTPHSHIRIVPNIISGATLAQCKHIRS